MNEELEIEVIWAVAVTIDGKSKESHQAGNDLCLRIVCQKDECN